jgi:hypothetical protein
MPTKVALYTLQSEASAPELEGPMGCCEGDTCADLCVHLEAAGVLDWSFQFWDYDQKCRIKNKMERLNPIGNNVYVIRCSDVGSELGKCTFEEAFGDTLDADLGFTVGVEEPAVIEALSDSVPPPESSRVSRSDIEIPEFDLQSLLVPQEAIDKYKMCHARLKKELKLISLEDHVWTLKSFDNNNVGVVKLQCGKCQKDFGGGSGDHSKSTIHNLFANFKKSHIMSNAHIRNWCRRKGIPWTEHPQSSVQKGKILILTTEDHKRAIEDGLAILDMVNRDICAEGGPFVAIGDLEGDDIKSF